jgi:hypothetical protein
MVPKITLFGEISRNRSTYAVSNEFHSRIFIAVPGVSIFEKITEKPPTVRVFIFVGVKGGEMGSIAWTRNILYLDKT